MPCNLTTKSSHFLFDSSQKQVAFLALFILIPILEFNTVYSYIGYFPWMSRFYSSYCPVWQVYFYIEVYFYIGC